MITRLGLDPAINSPGVAVARGPSLEKLELVGAWNVKIPAAFKRLSEGDRIQAVAERIAWELGSRPYNSVGECCGLLEDGDEVVYERPQIYGPGRGKGDPNELIKVAEVAAATIAHLNRKAKVIRVTPREWTGGTSKNVDAPFDSSRWRRLAMILTAEEQARVPEQHDAIDGVGLSLHETPRGLSTPRRVYPGASPPQGLPAGVGPGPRRSRT